MSKLFDKIRAANPGEMEANGNVERWLHTIQSGTGEQLAPLITPRLHAIRKGTADQLATFVTPSEQPVPASTSVIPSIEREPERIQPAEIVPNVPTAPARQSFRRVALPKNLERALFFENNSNREASEAYRTIRTRLLGRQAVSGISTIVVTSAAAGEGKTLTTLNLGLCCTRVKDAKVLIVDGDLRTRGLSSLLQIPEAPGLSEMLAEEADFADVVMATDVPNFFILAGGFVSSHPSELFARPRWKHFLSWARENFKLVLIDSPPMIGLADFELISSSCDAVLGVVRAGKTNQQVFKQSIAQIDSRRLLGVVLNAAEQASSNYPYYSGMPSNSPKTR